MAIGGSSRRNEDGAVQFSRTFTLSLFIFSILLIVFDRPEARPVALSTIRAGIMDAATPILDLAAVPVRRINNIQPYWVAQARLAEENAELRQRLNEVAYWQELALQLRDQREIYEEALNVESPATENRIGAWTLGDPDSPFVQSRLIGAGSRRGVEEGDPVLNVNGLVGRIVEAGGVSSRVLLLTDLNSRIPVMADRSNARAVMVGDNSPYPRLDFLGRDADLRDGDRIVTSGDDGLMPRGLPVGQAQRDRQGRWRVRLFSDRAPVDFVWVFPFEPVGAPVPDPASETDPPIDAEVASDLPEENASTDPIEAGTE